MERGDRQASLTDGLDNRPVGVTGKERRRGLHCDHAARRQTPLQELVEYAAVEFAERFVAGIGKITENDVIVLVGLGDMVKGIGVDDGDTRG